MSGDQATQNAGEETRRVFTTQPEAAAAVVDISACARRNIEIFSPTLEPLLYEQMEFLDRLKQMILGRRYARVRVLLHDPAAAVRKGHRLVELSRHLSSFIEIRTTASDYEGRIEDFMIADATAFVFRARASQWHGVADSRYPPIARKHLEFFNEVWERSQPEQEFRRLHL